MKIKQFTFFILIITTLLFITSCNNSNSSNSDTKNECAHLWQNATCTTPKTCLQCNKVEGQALGHTWTEATCTTPKTCLQCNKVEGQALGHTWAEATCASPKTCLQCNKVDGQALEHMWREATCASPKTCSQCNKTEGEIAAHYDSGDGTCKYCNQDILLLDLKEGFDVKLIIPTVGGNNYYCQVKYANNTNYIISNSYVGITANGKTFWDAEDFTLEPGYYAVAPYYRSITTSGIYDPANKDAYLDNSSVAFAQVEINGKVIHVKFDVNGTITFGYSYNDVAYGIE